MSEKHPKLNFEHSNRVNMPVLQNEPNPPTVNNTTAPNLTDIEEAKLLEGVNKTSVFFFDKLTI